VSTGVTPLPRQCAILAGGLGTRLGKLTQDTPKPMLDVAGRPFLAWLMGEAVRWGIEEFVLLTGHLGDRVKAQASALAAFLARPVSIRISNEPALAGTGGALRHARELLDDRFLLLNGDSLFLADLGPALAAFACDTATTRCRMILRMVPDAGRYGVASLEGDRVSTFRERPDGSGPGLINSGIYLMDRRVAERAAPTCSLERDVLPELIAEAAVRGTVAEGWFIDIGVPDDLYRARIELPGRVRRSAIPVERDGASNRNRG
jgi:NDP-sugar pyrophosphorylase family protein